MALALAVRTGNGKVGIRPTGLTCGYVDRSRGRAVITRETASACACGKGTGFTADVLESTTATTTTGKTCLYAAGCCS